MDMAKMDWDWDVRFHLKVDDMCLVRQSPYRVSSGSATHCQPRAVLL